MSVDPAYLGVCLRVFDDLFQISPAYTYKDCQRDKALVIQRVRAEGISFVTKTLPGLAKHMESAFQTGSFVPVASFKRCTRRTTPAFLGSLFKEIFDDSGLLLDNAPANAVRAIRQVCYIVYKLEVDYPQDLVDETIKKFVDTDRSLPKATETREQRLIIRIASYFIGRIFADFNPADIVPRPGPGASASGTAKKDRYEPRTLYDNVHQRYPYYEYFYVSRAHLFDRITAYRGLPRKKHATSLMRMVNKDSRGPRIICMEEQEYMFLQQGLGTKIMEHLENHPLTKGHVNFYDQTINQNLARRASITQEYATLDMSEASDRVSRDLVYHAFSKVPLLRDSLLALSTPEVALPGGEIFGMQKFAPMGSSLCFPIESIIHYATAVAIMHVATGRNTRRLAKEVYVYGDDIIVPTEYVGPLFDGFPLFGMKFNQGKSFVKGPFRESCGFDAFKGENVSPARLKNLFFDLTDPTLLESAMDVHAILYDRRLFGAAAMIKTVIESRHGAFPPKCPGSAVLGWVTNPSEVADYLVSHRRFSSRYQSYEIRCRKIVPPENVKMNGEWEQLMRYLVHAKRNSSSVPGASRTHSVRWVKADLSEFYPIDTNVKRAISRLVGC